MMTPLGGGPSFVASRTFNNPGPTVDWIEFTMFNTVTNVELATDFYISSLQITSDDVAIPEPGSMVLWFILGASSAFRRWRTRK